MEIVFNYFDSNADPVVFLNIYQFLKCSLKTLKRYYYGATYEIIKATSEIVLQNLITFFDNRFSGLRKDLLKLLSQIISSLSIDFRPYVNIYAPILENIFNDVERNNTYEVRGIAFQCMCSIIDIADDQTIINSRDNILSVLYYYYIDV